MPNVWSAPAKVIISGEHAVVHGFPALAGALSLRLTVSSHKTPPQSFTPQTAQDVMKELGLKISSNIPRGSGLGSSAALSAATAAAWLHTLNKQTTKEDISELALQFEKHFHAKPSGIDTTTSTYGGLLWFRRETPQLILKQSLQLPSEPVFAIIQTGKPKETTAQMVEMVRERLAAKKKSTQSIFQNIESCTRGIADELLLGKVDSLSLQLNENGLLLEELGVVSQKTQSLCHDLRSKGLACKITGAGGKREHSGALLVYCPDVERYNLLNAFNLTWDKASFSARGVEMEESV